LVDALDEHDDVVNVYANFDISEEDLAKLSAWLTTPAGTQSSCAMNDTSAS